MKLHSVLLSLVLTLSSCTTALDQIRSMSAADLINARAKAQAAGDKYGDWCWASLQPIVVHAPGSVVGVASAIEDSRIVSFSALGPCNGILAPDRGFLVNIFGP